MINIFAWVVMIVAFVKLNDVTEIYTIIYSYFHFKSPFPVTLRCNDYFWLKIIIHHLLLFTRVPFCSSHNFSLLKSIQPWNCETCVPLFTVKSLLILVTIFANHFTTSVIFKPAFAFLHRLDNTLIKSTTTTECRTIVNMFTLTAAGKGAICRRRFHVV